MKEVQLNFLALLGQPPARLSMEQTAWVLNCQPRDIPLKPLGNPPANGPKVFAATHVLENSKDTVWLAMVTNALHQYWRGKNARKKRDHSRRLENPPSVLAI